MLDECQGCKDLYDADGYWEHGCETMWWCTCGKITGNRGGEMLDPFDIDPSEVDFKGIEGRSGMFIRKTRWKGYKAPEVS